MSTGCPAHDRSLRLIVFSSALRPKGVTEALHRRATGRYMIGPHVTVNPLIFMAVVTVLVSWRLNCGVVCIARVCLRQSLCRLTLFSLQ